MAPFSIHFRQEVESMKWQNQMVTLSDTHQIPLTDQDLKKNRFQTRKLGLKALWLGKLLRRAHRLRVKLKKMEVTLNRVVRCDHLRMWDIRSKIQTMCHKLKTGLTLSLNCIFKGRLCNLCWTEGTSENCGIILNTKKYFNSSTSAEKLYSQ